MDRSLAGAVPHLCHSTRGSLSDAQDCMMATDAQKAGIRKTVTFLVIFVVAVFAWSIIKYLI